MFKKLFINNSSVIWVRCDSIFRIAHVSESVSQIHCNALLIIAKNCGSNEWRIVGEVKKCFCSSFVKDNANAKLPGGSGWQNTVNHETVSSNLFLCLKLSEWSLQPVSPASTTENNHQNSIGKTLTKTAALVSFLKI